MILGSLPTLGLFWIPFAGLDTRVLSPDRHKAREGESCKPPSAAGERPVPVPSEAGPGTITPRLAGAKPRHIRLKIHKREVLCSLPN